MAIEIVDLPTNSMVIFHSYVSLPEGNYWDQMWDRTTKCHQMVWYLKMEDLRILAMLLCWLI